MPDINEIKEALIKDIRWESINPRPSGGQQCGMPVLTQQLNHDELGIKIQVSYYRSSLKNRELAMKMFDVAMDDVFVKAVMI
jgi:protein subunit release factor A